MTYCEFCGYHPTLIDENKGNVLNMHYASKDEGIAHCEECCDKYRHCDDSDKVRLYPFNYGKESIEKDVPKGYE